VKFPILIRSAVPATLHVTPSLKFFCALAGLSGEKESQHIERNLRVVDID
jgi:hypothetical protein